MNTVIVANGQISDQQTAAKLLQEAEMIVAANGGTHHCLELDILPALVVGDLDSLNTSTIEELRQAEVELIQHPKRKDATDLELALELVKDRRALDIIVVGAVGGRWDQTLANFHLIASSRWRGLRLEVIDGPQSVYPIHPGEAFDLEGQAGDLVSLIPFGGDAVGVSSSGLEYSLDGERLVYDRSRGISNVLVDPPGRISLDAGVLLCVVIRGGEQQLRQHGGL